MKRIRFRWVLLAATGAVAAALVASAFRPKDNQPAHSRAEPQPVCWSVRFLSHQERLHPEPQWHHPVDAHEAVRPYPAEQVDNPVLFATRYVRARLENTTGAPLAVFARAIPVPEAESRQHEEQQRETIRNMRGVHGEEKAYLLSLLGTHAPRGYSAALCSELEELVTDANGAEVGHVAGSRWPRPGNALGSADEIRTGGYATHIIEPGQIIEFRMSVLGHGLSSAANIPKPGTYTVRAVLSYAEAPSGETRRVTSDPVTVTVTEEHIRAAEAYWASVQR